jgi:tetratricopeptide (TPR) repeat protein
LGAAIFNLHISYSELFMFANQNIKSKSAMKKQITIVSILLFVLVGCINQGSEKGNSNQSNEKKILGSWIRFDRSGLTALEFKRNGLLEIDMKNDGTIDVLSEYEIKGDTIVFMDIKGEACPDGGKYWLEVRDEYLAFDMAKDDCSGRIKLTSGFWTRPNYPDLIKQLDQKIEGGTDPNDYLLRGRIYMAIGRSKNAKSNFDSYIQIDTINYRAYLNRAATCFPHDMKGALADCNKVIELKPDNKNAYFLRGLALYDLGMREEACADFATAIDLGFDILRIAEQEKCEEFWAK